MKLRAIRTALLAKGMVEVKGDHTFYKRITPCGEALRTKVSLGASEVTSLLLGLMARQCQLSRKEFDLLIACPLSTEEWDAIVEHKKADGTLPHRW